MQNFIEQIAELTQSHNQSSRARRQAYKGDRYPFTLWEDNMAYYFFNNSIKMSDSPRPHDEFYLKSSKYRRHRLIAENHIFFVNAHTLAEFSTFFEKLFFDDNFLEEKEGEAELHNELWEDIEAFLNVMGMNSTKDRDEVDETNCALFLRLSDQWDIPVLRQRCITFLENELVFKQPDFDRTLEISIACCTFRVEGIGYRNVLERLAGFGQERLIAAKVHEKLTCGRSVAALFSAVKNESPSTTRNHSFSFFQHYTSECSIMGCCILRNLRKCKQCEFTFCDDHKVVDCGNHTVITSFKMGKKVEHGTNKLVPYKLGCQPLNSELFV